MRRKPIAAATVEDANTIITMRLLPEEVVDVNRFAAQEKRTRANLCRLLVLNGIEDLKRKSLAPAAANP